MKFKSRIASIKDADVIARIEKDSLAFEIRSDNWKPSVEELFNMWFHRLNKNLHIVIIASIIDNDKLVDVGFLSLHKKLRRGEIFTLYVDPNYFRMGVGKYLINIASSIVKSQKGTSLILHVQKENINALKFYYKQGFTNLITFSSELIKLKKEI